jgi:asparagine synthase (glutamine-hydrolysing)
VGEGADELFCGYPYWGKVLQIEPWARAYGKLPSVLRRLIYGVTKIMGGTFINKRRLDVLRRLTNGEDLFWGGAEAYPETVKHQFLRKDFIESLKGHSSADTIKTLRKDFEADAPKGADYLQWMAYLDLRLRLPELLLMRVDKMTMATSLEARVPFLDQEFVRLAMKIPQSLKFKTKTLKYLLKKAVEPILPHDIIYRKKQGFGVPVESWFKDKLQDWSNARILDFANRTEYFDPAAIKKYLDASTGESTWFLLNFVLWHEHWIENKKIDLPAGV